MRIAREWQHDRITEELAEVIVENLEPAHLREELKLGVWSDDHGIIEVSVPGSDRRFRLVLEEVVR